MLWHGNGTIEYGGGATDTVRIGLLAKVTTCVEWPLDDIITPINH